MYENNNGYYQPGINPTPTPMQVTDPTADAYVEEAFGKSLAATIMCSFPVASIIAIVFGSKGLELVEKAKMSAATSGAKLSGKSIAATILGKIGKIAGIVMTVFWGLYLLMLFAILGNL